MEQKRKIKKRILVPVLIVAVILLLWLVIFVISRIRLRRDRVFLKEQGYCNLVSAGDYSVNVLPFGNENGKHRIIAMAGMGVPDSSITMRKMTAALEPDNQVVFIDRAGCGLSDDTEQDMTVEHIVEAYRTALKNAGIQAPYVLMPHSIGGVYATYWESKYPDEIEAVAIIDGTELEPYTEEQIKQHETEPELLLYYRLCKLGAGGTGNLLLKHYLPPKDWLTADEQRMEYALTLMTYDSRAPLSESKYELENQNAAWHAIVTNDIPKLYITTQYLTAEDVEADGILTDEMIDALNEDSKERRLLLEQQYRNGAISKETFEQMRQKLPETDAEKRETAVRELLEQNNTFVRHVITPYLEKLGNCELISLPGDHLIYEQKPEKCSQIIKTFLGGLDG